MRAPERSALLHLVRGAAVAGTFAVALTSCGPHPFPRAAAGNAPVAPAPGELGVAPDTLGLQTAPVFGSDQALAQAAQADPGSIATVGGPPSPAMPAPPRSTGPSLPTKSITAAGNEGDTAAAQQAWETYILDLSGLYDSLNKVWIPKIQQVTTARLADASVRAAGAILDSDEHGVGVLRDDTLVVQLVSPTQADVTDCEDQYDFYIANDATSQPDPDVRRADLIGTAELVKQNGTWLVDLYRTTSATCTY